MDDFRDANHGRCRVIWIVKEIVFRFVELMPNLCCKNIFTDVETEMKHTGKFTIRIVHENLAAFVYGPVTGATVHATH